MAYSAIHENRQQRERRDEHENIFNILACFIRIGDTLSEEQGIKVFENRAQKTVYGSR